MPANKNQHFIPKFILKSFSNNGDNKSIRLFNTKSDFEIDRASIDGQASKPYFYGSDLSVESALCQLEGRYARLLKDIISWGYVKPHIATILTEFFSVQRNRTLSAQADIDHLVSGFGKVILQNLEGPEANGIEVSLNHSANFALSVGIRCHLQLLDLKRYLIVNQTKTPFILGDAPVVETNYFLSIINDSRHGGMSKSGYQTFMPISPRHAILLQDANVYSLPNAGGKIVLKKNRDVMHLNILQAVNSYQNFYFNECLRSTDLEEINRARKQYTTPEPRFGRFPILPVEENSNRGEIITFGGKKSPLDLNLSVMSLSKKPIYFDNGTMASPLRDVHWHAILRDLDARGLNLASHVIWTYIQQHPAFRNLGPWFQSDLKRIMHPG